jgi:TonB family protein
MVDIVPLSFDLKVESELIGEKARKGDKNFNITSAKKTSVPEGRTTKKSGASRKSILVANEKGKVVSDISTSSNYNLSSKLTISKDKGNGKVKLTLFINNFNNKDSAKLPAVAQSKLVPYLTKIRDRIADKWIKPYLSSAENRKVVICIVINKKGNLSSLNIETLSSDALFNRSAISAIYAAAPFEPLPKNVDLEEVKVKVEFELK